MARRGSPADLAATTTLSSPFDPGPHAVLSLDQLLRTLPARPEANALLADFVPPPRFAGKDFGGYRPDARHPSQAAALRRLREVGQELSASARGGFFRKMMGGGRRGGGVYLDGGFGVGKTHLLAALWNAAPHPKAYLSFDELMYTIGMLRVEGTREVFRGVVLACVDEWELDDPGNLKMALAFLRGALEDGVRVVTTSNTVPDELGRGRFSQKSFAAEIEELSGAFEVLRIDGEDFRHRRFEADPGAEYFAEDTAALEARARAAGERVVLTGFDALMDALRDVHPIRYTALAEGMDAVFVDGLSPIDNLPDGLRWVHFVDKLYDGAVGFAATSSAPSPGSSPPPSSPAPTARNSRAASPAWRRCWGTGKNQRIESG